MASAPEQTFIAAVNAAENTRQGAKATALATYVAAGFTPAARTAYVAALVAADVAYHRRQLGSLDRRHHLQYRYTALIGGNIGTIAT